MLHYEVKGSRCIAILAAEMFIGHTINGKLGGPWEQGYNKPCIILRGKLKEAATGYKSSLVPRPSPAPVFTNPMYTVAAPVILVVSYGTTRLLSNSPAHSHSRSLTPD